MALRRRKWFLLTSVSLLSLSTASNGLGLEQAFSRIMGGAVPLMDVQHFGQATVLLANKDGRTQVSILRSEPEAVAAALHPLLQTWTLPVGHEQSLTIRLIEEPGSGCTSDPNSRIVIRWPSEMSIYSPRAGVICEDPPLPVQDFRRPSLVRGVLTFEDGSVPDDLRVALYGLDELVGVIRRVNADRAGNFLLSDLTPGLYLGQVLSATSVAQEFNLRVDPYAKDEPLRLLLRNDLGAARRPAAVVAAAALPLYPRGAYADGVSGVVRLRVSLRPGTRASSPAIISDIDASGPDPRLVEAAKRNVASWRFMHVTQPIVPVTFVYALATGNASEQAPTTAIRYPHWVEIIERRIP